MSDLHDSPSVNGPGMEISTAKYSPELEMNTSQEASVASLAILERKPPKRFVYQQVPKSILNNYELNQAISYLPVNYSFEIHKTLWRLKQAKAKTVALQFPEGLLMYACIISDILERFAGIEHCFVMGDVTYGACCVDDFSAEALGVDFLVHYGHSCLIPVDSTQGVPCIYVFVDIKIDVQHLVESIRLNFKSGAMITLAGTIQFASAIQMAKQQLADSFPSLRVPQSKPLSPGEVLGCTAPQVASESDAIVFVADGRFHLEAIMIANPAIPAYRYDPYARVMTKESYAHEEMRDVRRRAIERSRSCKSWGLVLGTLGRQGNPRVLQSLQELVHTAGLEYTLVLLSEVTPSKLEAIAGIDVWVQVACPRLSIDWGEGFACPTLTPYEAFVALRAAPEFWKHGFRDPYPMDYYAREGGPWNSTWHRRTNPKQPAQTQQRN